MNDMTTAQPTLPAAAQPGQAFDQTKLNALLNNASAVAKGMQQAQEHTPGANFLPILKVTQRMVPDDKAQDGMRAEGYWVLGQMRLKIGPDEELTVDPSSFQAGIQLWESQKPKDSRMAAIWGKYPTLADAPAYQSRQGTNDGWVEQFEFQLKANDGTLMRFPTTSMGGSRAFHQLVGQVSEALVNQAPYIMPVVRLGAESYWNAKYSKYNTNPLFEVIDWADPNGNRLSQQLAEQLGAQSTQQIADSADEISEQDAASLWG